MKKSRWADWFLTAGFLGFLALALAVTLIRPKSGWSYYENRESGPSGGAVGGDASGRHLPGQRGAGAQDHAAGRNT